MDEQLKELYYSEKDTGSYGGVERLYRRVVEAKVPNISRNTEREFYFVSAHTIFTNPQDGTLSVTVSMWGVSINSGKQIWPIWSDLNETTINTDMFSP